MFNNVTLLMDKAVQQVKALEEAENYVRRHYLATRATLIAAGYSEEDADRRAGVRIFDEPPGIFNLNTSTIAEASGTWDSDRGMGDDYLRKMGHGFGNGFWGEPMEDVFRLALSGTEKSSTRARRCSTARSITTTSTCTWAASRAPSAISTASRRSSVVTNTRDPGKPEMSSIDEFIGTEFRSRYVNPTWIEGMKKEGYAGAGAMREFVEYLWGWDATVTETIDDAMWQETFEVYVRDKHGLDLAQFFDEKSPFAYQDITARMLETARKGYWQADEETRATLVREYLESVAEHGVGCSDNTCGNPRLLEYVVEQARAANVPAPDVAAFVAAVEQATGGRLDALATAAREFVAANEAQLASRVVPGPAESASAGDNIDAAELRGYLLRNVAEPQPPESGNAADAPPADESPPTLELLLLAAAMLGVLLVWRQRRRAA